jgi:hypothetical protein
MEFLPQNMNDAICRVMAGVRRLEKGHRNEFAKYMFTSSDDFKDAVRPLLAENGLSIGIEEVELNYREIKGSRDKESVIASYVFEIQLRGHGTAEAPERITVALPFTGAQTTGAARSYAIKEWLKTKFLMSSGDVDAEADLTNHDSGERLSKQEARETYTGLQDELNEAVQNAATAQEIADWYKENEYRVNVLPKDWAVTFRNAALTAWKSFAGVKKAPAPEPEKPTAPNYDALISDICLDLSDAYSIAAVDAVERHWTGQINAWSSEPHKLQAFSAIKDRRIELQAKAEPEPRNLIAAGE